MFKVTVQEVDGPYSKEFVFDGLSVRRAGFHVYFKGDPKPKFYVPMGLAWLSYNDDYRDDVTTLEVEPTPEMQDLYNRALADEEEAQALLNDLVKDLLPPASR